VTRVSGLRRVCPACGNTDHEQAADYCDKDGHPLRELGPGERIVDGRVMYSDEWLNDEDAA
jgi:hypothetical protein